MKGRHKIMLEEMTTTYTGGWWLDIKKPHHLAIALKLSELQDKTLKVFSDSPLTYICFLNFKSISHGE